MTKEDFEKRMAALQGGATLLQQQIQQAAALLQQRQADLAATQGMMQECQYWASLAFPEGEEKPTA